jgi:hypothetical protein
VHTRALFSTETKFALLDDDTDSCRIEFKSLKAGAERFLPARIAHLGDRPSSSSCSPIQVLQSARSIVVLDPSQMSIGPGGTHFARGAAHGQFN